MTRCNLDHLCVINIIRVVNEVSMYEYNLRISTQKLHAYNMLL